MPTSIHAAGPTGQRSPGLDAAIAGYLAEKGAAAQVGAVTLPGSPARGQMVTAVVSSSAHLPAGVIWDEGGAPDLDAGRRIVGFVWTGADWVGTYSPSFPDIVYTTLSPAILDLSPVGYWKLNETSGTTATDSSGNGRHGTYTGTYTLNARDGAPTFAGGHVAIPDDDPFSIGAAGLTVFAIGYTAVDSEAAQFMVSKGAEGAYEWGMGVNWPDRGRTSFAVWWASGASNHQYEQTADAHPKSVWSALAVTVGSPSTSGGRFPLYRDSGVARATTQYDIAAGTPASGTAPVWIGGRADGWGVTWLGSLRHVAIFDQRLTAGQIGTLMDAARNEGLIP